MTEFLIVINEASATGDADAIKMLLTITYADMLSIDVDTIEVKDDESIFVKMTGLTYSSIEEIENVFLSAYKAQLYTESGKSDSIILSTVSQGFDGWNILSGNRFGGAKSFVENEENITRLSASGADVNADSDGEITGKFSFVNTAIDVPTVDYFYTIHHWWNRLWSDV